MRELEIFDQARQMARQSFIDKIKASVTDDGFDWLSLAEMLIEEGSPLQSLWTPEIQKTANVFVLSKKLSDQAGIVKAEPVEPKLEEESETEVEQQ